ncbi:hypothetical protein TrST_g10919 [Triparma strigata]|uniref:SET domain-containing protein n=1 Tax=Triparma strigata TaxID=1606541 RepID=A0A9W7EPT3_9STRA|nr:hypothetical protein TrST_g10919 [Triparma strigata]
MPKKRKAPSDAFSDLLAHAEPSPPAAVSLSGPPSDPNRCLISNYSVAKNETAFSIPFRKLITPESPHNFLEEVDKIYPDKNKNNKTQPSPDNLINNTDVALCLNLMALPVAHPYKSILPSQSLFSSCLPVCWESKVLAPLLKGSAVLISEIETIKATLRTLFDCVVSKISPSSSFPDFLNAWCVVSSRSFSVQDMSSGISVSALLPLVDMCNHSRPRVCSYKKSSDRVVLTALKDIKVGDEISITYGAKSSSELLRDYGFALPPSSNTEPDGSSNDRVKIKIRDNIVTFRAPGGGPSYSYFCLSEGVSAVKDVGESGVIPVEEFEEEEEWNDDDDEEDLHGQFDFGDEDEDEEDEDVGEGEGDIEEEIFSRVSLLLLTLKTSLSLYSSPPFSSNPSCLIVLSNDVRIINFYIKVCETILEFKETVKGEKDGEKIRKYVESLKSRGDEWEAVQAFCKLKLLMSLSKYF